MGLPVLYYSLHILDDFKNIKNYVLTVPMTSTGTFMFYGTMYLQ